MHKTGFVVCAPQPWQTLLLIVMAITHPFDRKNTRQQKPRQPLEHQGRNALATSACNLCTGAL
jgi:cbb3-type cytochrome oxidase cytochrome c subunit